MFKMEACPMIGRLNFLPPLLINAIKACHSSFYCKRWVQEIGSLRRSFPVLGRYVCLPSYLPKHLNAVVDILATSIETEEYWIIFPTLSPFASWLRRSARQSLPWASRAAEELLLAKLMPLPWQSGWKASSHPNWMTHSHSQPDETWDVTLTDNGHLRQHGKHELEVVHSTYHQEKPVIHHYTLYWSVLT